MASLLPAVGLGSVLAGGAAAVPAGAAIVAGAAGPTIGFGTAAAVAGIGLGAVGVIGSGVAASNLAEAQASQAEFNARIQEREAQHAEQVTLFRQRRQAKEAERQRSALQASIGASGVVSGVGAPLLIQQEQAEESELDILLIGAQGQTAAARARSQGALDIQQAGIFRQRGASASTAGIIGAGTSLLTGFGQLSRRRF